MMGTRAERGIELKPICRWRRGGMVTLIIVMLMTSWSQVQIVILTMKLSIKTIMMLPMFLFTSRRGPGSPLGERESETLSFYQVILFENRSQNVRISTCFLLQPSTWSRLLARQALRSGHLPAFNNSSWYQVGERRFQYQHLSISTNQY